MALSAGFTADLPTNYGYYTDGGINQGLNANQSFFTLNDKLIRIYSGSMHYFRVPRAYWRDRLRKLRAAGLNTVETAIPWNLHEPQEGVFDFGSGGSEMEDFLHLEEFLNIAKEEDLFVILRPGPSIDSEFNFGGFPSWLLREPMSFRTSESNFMKHVTRYFNVLLTILASFQFIKGGPVIAFEVEYNYGAIEFKDSRDHPKFDVDKVYLQELHDLFRRNGIEELLITSDHPVVRGSRGSIKDLFLLTAIVEGDIANNLEKQLGVQPDRPLYVLEYWVGHYDVYFSDHNTKDDEYVRKDLEDILSFNASLGVYMFHGGTNFGFTNGAYLSKELTDNSELTVITTSYYSDAPLTENGGYTNKYQMIKYLIAHANPVKTFVPEQPEYIPAVVYDETVIEKFLPLEEIITKYAPYSIRSQSLLPMEYLYINENAGQTNGYIVYRKENLNLTAKSQLVIEGHVCDTVIVLLDGKLIGPTKFNADSVPEGFGFWHNKNSSIILNTHELNGTTLDLVVENFGRASRATYFQYNQTFKGLWQGDVKINNETVENWEIVPLEFKKQWVNSLRGFKNFTTKTTGPGIYTTTLNVIGEPRDTFISTRGWGKGVVFVNGFALGRYAAVGPQYSLYLPAPFLKTGENQIYFYEHFYPTESGNVTFVPEPLY